MIKQQHSLIRTLIRYEGQILYTNFNPALSIKPRLFIKCYNRATVYSDVVVHRFKKISYVFYCILANTQQAFDVDRGRDFQEIGYQTK